MTCNSTDMPQKFRRRPNEWTRKERRERNQVTNIEFLDMTLPRHEIWPGPPSHVDAWTNEMQRWLLIHPIVQLVWCYCGPRWLPWKRVAESWYQGRFEQRSGKRYVQTTTPLVDDWKNHTMSESNKALNRHVNEPVAMAWPDCIDNVFYFGTFFHPQVMDYHLIGRCSVEKDSFYFYHWQAEGPCPWTLVFGSLQDLMEFSPTAVRAGMSRWNADLLCILSIFSLSTHQPLTQQPRMPTPKASILINSKRPALISTSHPQPRRNKNKSTRRRFSHV